MWHNTLRLSLVVTLLGCSSSSESVADTKRPTLSKRQSTQLVGTLASPLLPETDQRPSYKLSLEKADTAPRDLGIIALDATLDDTGTMLFWLDAQQTLWQASLADAPQKASKVAENVLPGLAVTTAKLAFAQQQDAPESAPFVFDLASQQLTALPDAEGPDEVLAFSPKGTELLLLSGRTGLTSLFVLSLKTQETRQITNVGLRPGPTLDRAAITPPIEDRHRVVWGENGIAFLSGGKRYLLRPGEKAIEIAPNLSLEEIAR